MLGPHGGRGVQKRPKNGPHGLCMTPSQYEWKNFYAAEGIVKMRVKNEKINSWYR